MSDDLPPPIPPDDGRVTPAPAESVPTLDSPPVASSNPAPALTGAQTAQWVGLGVLAFFGLPLLGALTYGIGFLLGAGWLAWAGVQAWRRGEPSRARVRRFLVGVALGFVIFGGCAVLVLGNLGNMH